MDVWLVEWLDNESARLKEQEAREERRQRTIANWRVMRFWKGQN